MMLDSRQNSAVQRLEVRDFQRLLQDRLPSSNSRAEYYRLSGAVSSDELIQASTTLPYEVGLIVRGNVRILTKGHGTFPFSVSEIQEKFFDTADLVLHSHRYHSNGFIVPVPTFPDFESFTPALGEHILVAGRAFLRYKTSTQMQQTRVAPYFKEWMVEALPALGHPLEDPNGLVGFQPHDSDTDKAKRIFDAMDIRERAVVYQVFIADHPGLVQQVNPAEIVDKYLK